MERGTAGRIAEVYGRVWTAWFADDAVGLRQLPLTISFALVLVIHWTSGIGSDGLLVALAAALVVAVQAVGSLGRWDRWPTAWRYVLPLVQMLAIGVLSIGSTLSLASFHVLFVLPVVSLALQPGPWGLVVALCGSAVLMFVPSLLPITKNDVVHPAVHALVDLLIIGFVAVGAHGIVGVARRQARELALARDDLAVGAQRLRDSRDTLRSMMAAATEQGFVATDEAGTVVSVNVGAERVLGRREADLLGTPMDRFVAPEELAERLAAPGAPHGPDAVHRVLVGCAATGGTQVDEWVCVLPDGGRRHLEFVVTPRPALGGSAPELPAGYLFVVTDVTARFEDERTQDEFIGLVSHELRTPLASILGYLDLLRLDGSRLDEEQRGYLAVVERNAHRLQTLVDDLLTSAQIVSGTYRMVAEEVDVVQVARDAVASQAPTAAAAGVDVEVQGDPRVPLLSDADRLGQVVDNLLSNAVKYSRRGGDVRIVVTADRAPDGGRRARVRVADDGTGIAPDELDRVIQRFYRTRDTRRRQVRGVGLGLALVDQIVHDHGGTMTIRSELGHGTEVDVVLPDLAGSVGRAG
ncbi:ATP-binding protein [Isoptericola sp. NPDC055881]